MISEALIEKVRNSQSVIVNCPSVITMYEDEVHDYDAYIQCVVDTTKHLLGKDFKVKQLDMVIQAKGCPEWDIPALLIYKTGSYPNRSQVTELIKRTVDKIALDDGYLLKDWKFQK